MAVDSKKLVVSLFSALLFVFFVGAVARVEKSQTEKLRFVLLIFVPHYDYLSTSTRTFISAILQHFSSFPSQCVRMCVCVFSLWLSPFIFLCFELVLVFQLHYSLNCSALHSFWGKNVSNFSNNSSGSVPRRKCRAPQTQQWRQSE